jgi:AP-2 complex subunit mu-1
MLSTLFISTVKGEILIFRQFKDNVTRHECQAFCSKMIASKEATDKPIYRLSDCSFVHIPFNDLTLVAATKENSNACLIVKFLYKFADLLKQYNSGGAVDESAVRRQFVLIYELIDEIIDYGFPQIMEHEILRKYVTQGGLRPEDLNDEENLKQITVAATGATPWRPEGVKYKKNEVYIDVIENVNVLVSKKGTLLKADVQGSVMVKCQLSGMPECKFGMNDKLVMTKAGASTTSPAPPSMDKGIALDDVRFHQCVRLSKFEQERAITFIPPDGQFELMSYRITENVACPFKILPVVVERGRTKIDVTIKMKSVFEKSIAANNVVVKVPCPKSTASASFAHVSGGKAKYEPANDALVWRIRRFPGETEFVLQAEIDLVPTMHDKGWLSKPPISIDFQVPMFTASGLRVRFLRVQEKSNYKPVKWIRYITKAGSYQHRLA